MSTATDSNIFIDPAPKIVGLKWHWHSIVWDVGRVSHGLVALRAKELDITPIQIRGVVSHRPEDGETTFIENGGEFVLTFPTPWAAVLTTTVKGRVLTNLINTFSTLFGKNFDVQRNVGYSVVTTTEWYDIAHPD